ncbi:hypothetical protein AX774_g4286 [Zancudomyces culisetae]|uniref:Uncharacterized protein n=1 Tax=Zancudomyces culisetae TaxID=1213189 RepID=A0A1R1PMP5_ZANCU|nr:hypothetical protein AX774_g4286 [Zancudomyces culisetae]|eukprot:OMH82245.1 hypothetical protein AX774_g4286 [Zancudomyces culisetae]
MIYEMRQSMQLQVVHTVEDYTRRMAIRNLADTRNFTKDQLSLIYQNFYEALYYEEQHYTNSASSSISTANQQSKLKALSSEHFNKRDTITLSIYGFVQFMGLIADWAKVDITSGKTSNMSRSSPSYTPGTSTSTIPVPVAGSAHKANNGVVGDDKLGLDNKNIKPKKVPMISTKPSPATLKRNKIQSLIENENWIVGKLFRFMSLIPKPTNNSMMYGSTCNKNNNNSKNSDISRVESNQEKPNEEEQIIVGNNFELDDTEHIDDNERGGENSVEANSSKIEGYVNVDVEDSQRLEEEMLLGVSELLKFLVNNKSKPETTEIDEEASTTMVVQKKPEKMEKMNLFSPAEFRQFGGN